MVEGVPAKKIPLAARKSIRDNFDSYIPKFEQDTTKLLGEPWTMEVDWAELLDSCGTERNWMSEDPGAAVQSYFSNAIDQLKYLTKDGTDDMIKEGLAEAAPKKIMSVKADPDLKGIYGCAFEDGKLFIVFKKGNDFGGNAHKTFEELESKL